MKSALLAAGVAIAALALFGSGSPRSEVLPADIQGTFHITAESRARLKKLGFVFDEYSSFAFAGERFVATALPACMFDSRERKVVRAEGRFVFRNASSMKLEFFEPRPFGVISSEGGISFARQGTTVVLSVVSSELKSDGPLQYVRRG